MATLGIDIGGTSVKAAALEGDIVLWTGSSASYVRAELETLTTALQEAVAGRLDGIDAVGLCVPGLLDEAKTRVTLSVNVPGLMALPLRELLEQALGTCQSIRVANDAVAAAVDYQAAHQLRGRLLGLAIGTGVGAAVLDDDRPLVVEGDSPGHLGQIDVSLDEHAPLGPDGGAGSLEGYLGAGPIIEHYGCDLPTALTRMQVTDPPLRALVRTLRIAHAFYRPNHIVLLGGIGLRLGQLLPAIEASVRDRLTSVARSDWTLACADHDFHAAQGAARLAMPAS